MYICKMKTLLSDDDKQEEVSKMYKILKQNHPDIIDGIPEHCISIVIANYIYSSKDEEKVEQKISAIKVKDEEICDSLSVS